MSKSGLPLEESFKLLHFFQHILSTYARFASWIFYVRPSETQEGLFVACPKKEFYLNLQSTHNTKHFAVLYYSRLLLIKSVNSILQWSLFTRMKLCQLEIMKLKSLPQTHFLWSEYRKVHRKIFHHWITLSWILLNKTCSEVCIIWT